MSNPQIAEAIDKASAYDFNVEYIPGQKNQLQTVSVDLDALRTT